MTRIWISELDGDGGWFYLFGEETFSAADRGPYDVDDADVTRWAAAQAAYDMMQAELQALAEKPPVTP